MRNNHRSILCVLAAGLPVLAAAPSATAEPAAESAPAASLTVEFPPFAAAREAIVDDRAEPYFSLLRPHDMAAKTNALVPGATPEAQRAECRKRYCDAVLEFTADEQEALRGAVGQIHPVLASQYPLVAALPWSFLKTGDTVEGGLPHTRGRHIVLPASAMRDIERGWKSSGKMALPQEASLLAHEQLHVFQRANPRAFDTLYAGLWGFARALRIEGCPALEAREAVNPDATDLGWVFPVRSDGDVRWIWPRVLFKDGPPGPRPVFAMPADFRLVAVDLEEAPGGGFRVKKDGNGRPVTGELMEIPEYMRAFAGSTYVFHPAEAAADLFGSIVAADTLFSRKFALLKESRKATEARQGPVRAWFREHLRVR